MAIQRENELMARLSDWLGHDEMERSGGMWRVWWVRRCPQEVESEMRWGQQLEGLNDPSKPRNRAAWMVFRLTRIAGVRSVRELNKKL